MIASTIGRTFLKAYNNKTRNNYTAKEFFEKEYWPLFYDSPKYMQWITNSPFVQGLSSDPKGVYGIREKIKDDDGKTLFFDLREKAIEYLHEQIIPRQDFLYCNENDRKKVSVKGIEIIKTLNSKERLKLLNDFQNKTNKALVKNEFDGSIAIGFPASEVDEFPVASGQVSDISFKYKEDDIYLSWIGNGLGVGVAGGYTIFFNNGQILFSLFEGWQVYRELLNDKTINHQGKQVDTWNGQWLSFKYDRFYNGENDFVSLQKAILFNYAEDSVVSIETITWSQVMFKISQTIDTDKMICFIGNFAKTNKTLGFYPFYFSKARTLIKYYKILFGEQAALDDQNKYESLFGIYIKRACELGSIGLQALEPKDLRKYFGNDANLKLTKPNINQKGGETEEDYSARKSKAFLKDYENIITYRTYKTWLLAMITKNKEESLEYTSEVAKALLSYRIKDKKGSTKRANLVKTDLLASKSKKAFIDALAVVIKDIDEGSLGLFKKLRDRVHMMSAEDFGYFVVLLKFDYAYEERNS